MRLRIRLAAALVFASMAGMAQEPTRALMSIPTDPTEFGSLRLDPFESVAPPPGRWTIVGAVSYFNQWNGTWHTRRVHEGWGRAGQPIQDDELHALERDFPEDDIYRVDVEGSRFDLLVARGFANGMSLQARIPWIEIGAPQWDSVAETFHEAFPVVEHYVRDLFPRGQTFVYLRADGRSVVRREDLARGGFGDAAFTLGVPLRATARASERLAFTIEAPTGRENSLHGSGGWDLGVRWFRRWSGRRNDYLVGAGYSHQSDQGSLLGFSRSDSFHLAADVVRPLSTRTALHFAGRVDSSPLAGITDMNLADPVFFYRLGAQFATGANQWISVDLGEEIAPQMGVDTDFSLHIGWGTHLW